MRFRSDEPGALIESAFDRELQEALDIDPSPEFLARVRTRLASEPEPSAWRFPWLLASAGALAIVVAAAAVISQRNVDPVVVQTVRSAAPDPAVGQTPESAAPSGGSPASDSVVGRTFRSAVTGSRSAVTESSSVADSASAFADSKQLEVIISPDEVRGLKTLIAMVNEEDAGLEALLAGPTILATVGPEGEITLPPIKIDPLIPETDSDTQ